MAGFLETLRNAFTCDEGVIPVCSFERTRRLNIVYKYFPGHSYLHRLEFRKGNRPVFEILLPRPAENLAQLCAALTSQAYRHPDGGAPVFGFWFRMTLWFLGGKMISCRNLFPIPEDNMHTPFGDLQTNQCYRLAYFKNGAKESIVLIYLESSEQTTSKQKSRQIQLNWQKLSVAEAAALADHLRAFLAGEKFSGAQKGLKQKV